MRNMGKDMGHSIRIRVGGGKGQGQFVLMIVYVFFISDDMFFLEM
jgi:hypothetical protein